MERIPPQSDKAEKAVIGACLLNEMAVSSALEVVRPQDFYRREHQLIFEAIYALNGNGQACDVITVAAQLEKEGCLEQVGGHTYLADLTAEVPSAASAAYYGRIVADKAMQRALILSAEQVIDDGYSGKKDGLEILGEAEKAFSVIGERSLHQNLRLAESVMNDEFARIDTIKAKDGVTGVPTLRDIDRFLSGLQKGDLIILAARPGMGKTSLALNIAANAVRRNDLSVVVFSLEMPSEQLAQRVLCSRARVDQKKWRGGHLNGEDTEKLSQAMSEFAGRRFYFDDTAGITVPEMKAKSRRLQKDGGLDLIVVDYLQLMHAPFRIDNRQQEIAEISRSLKQLAKELSVPVLALSQLSRLVEQSPATGRGAAAPRQPQLSHLRESGALEQDADVVIFLNKPKAGEDGTLPEGVMEVIIAKNRNGPTGEDLLAWQRQYTLFGNLNKEFPPPIQ